MPLILNINIWAIFKYNTTVMHHNLRYFPLSNASYCGVNIYSFTSLKDFTSQTGVLFFGTPDIFIY